jgi:flagellar biosynthesis chaperone FliJ
VSRLIASRKRLLRVRDVQHNQAVAAVTSARDEAQQIADNARRIERVRAELFGDAGVTTGANLAARRELAARLERAGRQLDGALYDANRRVDARDAERIERNREREIAERLKDKAQAAREALREKRLQALPRYRRMAAKGTEE